MVAGAGMLVLLGVNVAQLLAFRREPWDGWRPRRLGQWAWGVSVAALLVPYFAPVALTMAVIDRQKVLRLREPLPALRPSRMAIVNSLWAVIAIVSLIAVMFSTGILRWGR
jgi:hypothetical protein